MVAGTEEAAEKRMVAEEAVEGKGEAGKGKQEDWGRRAGSGRGACASQEGAG